MQAADPLSKYPGRQGQVSVEESQVRRSAGSQLRHCEKSVQVRQRRLQGRQAMLPPLSK